ncbi:hypothetical protein HRD49_13115 [Corallococcus exiguus]|uniref:hypothetical protein n=1 Tax=Corallococcus TaxID=83461 RepID=UPI000EA2ACE0|nr:MULTISPECIES: hypothetical protein [Corallococcus]NRD55958.1 hypothetical protein [Corallococcus exiguus]NRD62686.1 hypothetical protein [Corallococcus exiguus]RKH24558.1 hypothetical protein D7V77_20450 [Corallococcus sp. CA041A]RKI08107.1 hypothetical protein D7Y15_26585 [Corallococcus sp. AB030]
MRLCAALTALSLLASCTTTYAIPKPELTRLDGFRDENAALMRELGDVMLNRVTDRKRTVRDVEGQAHQFTSDTPLALVSAQSDTEFQRFIEVGVDGDRFRGVPLEGSTSSAAAPPVVVSLSEVDHARLREFSLGKTLLLTGTIGVALMGSLVMVSKLFKPTTGSDPDDRGGVIDLGPTPRLTF